MLSSEKTDGDWDHNRTATEMQNYAIANWVTFSTINDIRGMIRHEGSPTMSAADGHAKLVKLPARGKPITNLRQLGDVRTGGNAKWARGGQEIIFMRETGVPEGGF